MIAKNKSSNKFPSELLEYFNHKTLRALVNILIKDGREHIDNARKDTNYSYWPWVAAINDANYRCLMDDTLAFPIEQNILSNAQMNSFSEYVEKEEYLSAAEDAATYRIRTGNFLGTLEERRLMKGYIKKEVKSALGAGLSITDSGYAKLAEYIAAYRILTGNMLVDQKLQEDIIKGAKQRVPAIPYYSSDANIVSAIRILKIKNIELIPGKGIWFLYQSDENQVEQTPLISLPKIKPMPKEVQEGEFNFDGEFGAGTRKKLLEWTREQMQRYLAVGNLLSATENDTKYHLLTGRHLISEKEQAIGEQKISKCISKYLRKYVVSSSRESYTYTNYEAAGRYIALLLIRGKQFPLKRNIKQRILKELEKNYYGWIDSDYSFNASTTEYRILTGKQLGTNEQKLKLLEVLQKEVPKRLNEGRIGTWSALHFAFEYAILNAPKLNFNPIGD